MSRYFLASPLIQHLTRRALSYPFGPTTELTTPASKVYSVPQQRPTLSLNKHEQRAPSDPLL